MSRREEHIDSMIRRLIFVSLFLLTIVAFKGYHSKSRGLFQSTATIEYTLTANHSATISAPADFQSTDNSLSTCKVLPSRTFENNNLGLLSSNHTANNLLLAYSERFIKIKPQLLQVKLFHIRASLNCDDATLIS
jgi:hypothetical protein